MPATNVKPARTTSGGERLQPFDDWEGSGEAKPPQVREKPACWLNEKEPASAGSEREPAPAGEREGRGAGEVPSPASTALGVVWVPYHPVPVPRVPRYPGYTAVLYPHAASGVHAREQRACTGWCPGLSGGPRQRAGAGAAATSPRRFPYLRSIQPGHPDRPWAIRGKCWIATRSRPARGRPGCRA